VASGTIGEGVLVASRFRIERLAGSGGMGSVYRASDTMGQVPVALKIFKGSQERDLDRFEREARVLADLRHPGIVRYLAHGTTEDDERWIAMEWLEGVTLAEHVARGRSLSIDDSIALMIRVADAVGFAHRRGVVHRDLKPSNVFLPDSSIERAKVLDFGIAAVRRATLQITRTGVPVGTPGYMAPEQARGSKNVDARADVFALGCVLYRCLTGHRAFDGQQVMAVLTKILLEEVPRARTLRRDVPIELDDLVSRMLSKAPEDRPPDANAVESALREIAERSAPTTAGTLAPPSGSALTNAERRLVCVLMARPAESIEETSVTSEGTPSTLGDDVRAIAHRFGGTLEILADGSLLIVFRATGAATDQAVGAARCALALRPLLAFAPMALAAGRGEVSEGLHTGEIIDRGIDLLTAHDEGAIGVDDVIVGLLDARFEVVLGEKGASVLRGEHDDDERLRTMLGRPTQCVGRERELATIDVLLAECMDERIARVALLVGVEGVGKSRVRQELVRRLRASTPRAQIWFGRGDPMRAGSPFGLLAQPLQRIAAIQEGEPQAERFRKLRERVARNVAPKDVARVAEFLGEIAFAQAPAEEASPQLRAARSDATLMGDQMLRAWLDLMTAECTVAPLVIVLEDLRHADLTSIRFVDAALRTLHDRPLFVLGVARPEVFDVFPRLWDDRGAQRIRIGELTKRAAEALARQVLGDAVPQEHLTKLVERAAGNALYLEELLRAYVRDPNDALPGSVQAMVQARLEGLGTEPRRVLRAASIFGDLFWVDGLVALLGEEGDRTQLADWIADLVDREVILPRARGEERFPGRQEYRFRHGLVRDVAYAMLTHADRTAGHRLAGEWLSSVGETDALSLAQHFDRGGEPARAIDLYRIAAEHALEGNDFAGAIDRAESGIRSGASGERLGSLRLVQAGANRWRGDLRQGQRAALEAISNLEPGSEPWVRAAAELAGTSGPLGDREQLISVARQMIDAFRPSEAHVIAAARTTMHLLHLGEMELGDELMERTRERAQSIVRSDPLAAAHTHRTRAMIAVHHGRLGASLDHMRTAADAFRSAGDLRGAAVAGVDVGYLLIELGAYAEALEVLRRTSADADRLDLRTVRSFAWNAMMLPLVYVGLVEEARAIAAKAIREFSAQGDRRFEASTREYLARIHLLAGELQDAEREARLSASLADHAPPTRARAHATLSRALRALKSDEESFAAASEAWGVLQSLGSFEEGEAYVRLAYAEALEASGDAEGAHAVADDARKRLLERAKSASAPYDASFLSAVPENAKILERAQ